jgi:hypothetical protein
MIIVIIIGLWPFLYPDVTLSQIDLVRNTVSERNGELVPEILMIYNGTGYHGEIIDYNRESGDIFSNPDILPSNSTTNLSNLYVKVITNSNVEFLIKDNYAPEDKPDSIAVTAYYS